MPTLDPLGWLLRADARYRDRRRVEDMTPEQLRDIGVTRAEIEAAMRRR